MTTNKRKKSVKFRGSKTHGWGSMKKHRGAGNRGGRGMAGTGKRADQKKPSIIKQYGHHKNYFGKHGFKRPQKVIKKIKTINIEDLKQDKKQINLQEEGYGKLLGKGTPKQAYEIKVKSYSKLAKEKIEKAGGSITKIE